MARKEQIALWVKPDLQLTNIHRTLERQGVVPYRTLFACEQCDFGAKRITLRVLDGKLEGSVRSTSAAWG